MILAACVTAACLAVEPRQPNVIIIVADDQGYGDLSCHGHPLVRTPAIDRLHAEGVRLADFHVAPMCSPTRGQLMTGRDALRNGAYSTCQGHSSLRTTVPTLPEVLGRAGWQTGIFGKWHLGHAWPERPQDRGFSEVLTFVGNSVTDVADRWNNDNNDPWLIRNGVSAQHQGYLTDILFDAALAWIDARVRSGERFFAYIPVSDPHFPHWPKPGTTAAYASSATPEYLAMIATLDANVGRLREALAKRGIADDTLLVYTSDNGQASGLPVPTPAGLPPSKPGPTSDYNAGMRGGKCSRYDGGHRAPGFVYWPAGGVAGGRDVREPTQVQDLMPTILDACGVSERPVSDGISVLPALRGQASVPERTFVVQIRQIELRKGESAVVSGRWRLVDYRELYDIQADPGQVRNLASDHPDVVERLRAHYERWWAEVFPLASEVLPALIHPEHLPAWLTSAQWLDVRADGQAGPRVAVSPKAAEGGWWHIEVAEAGRYTIELRRYPAESGLPLGSGTPEFGGKHHGIRPTPAGVPLAIAETLLAVDDAEHRQPVAVDASASTFTIDLAAGRHRLRGLFRDAQQAVVCPAYYATIARP